MQAVEFVQYLYSKCAVGNLLNMTVTVSLCEKQSAAIYIDWVTVWGISGKKELQKFVIFPLHFLLCVRLSVFLNVITGKVVMIV